MAPRTLHQAMAYLGLAKQTEPARDNRPYNEDRYDREHAQYEDTRGVLYDQPEGDSYMSYEEDDFDDDVHFDEERTPSAGSVREDEHEPATQASSAHLVRDELSYPEVYEEKERSAGSVANTGPLPALKRQAQLDSVPPKPATPMSTNESEEELRRITTIHPRSYNDAKIIGESFRESIPVIMNVTDMGESEAKRLVDFSAGLAFALHGSIERVTDKVFLLTPANLEVLGAEGAEVPIALDGDSSDLFDQD